MVSRIYDFQACRDGTMLRDLDLNRQDCNIRSENANKVPLTNEHGDVFLRHNDYDDCGPVSGENGYEDFPPNQQYYNNQRPSPVESDYFYDQYVDYPVNDTVGNTLNNTLVRLNSSAPFVDFNNNKFNNQLPPQIRPPPSSQFTFFGHPLPSLSLGNVWGNGRTANNRAASGESTRGKGRVQIFRAGDPELQAIVNQPNSLDVNREPSASMKQPVLDSLEKVDEKFYRPYPNFQTPFSQPKPEKGFSPMVPGMTVGGFIPIHDPMQNSTKANDWPRDDDLKEVHLVTRAETQTRSTISKPLVTAQIDKIGSTTTSHLSTSLSPILSTLVPKVDVITERSHIDNMMEIRTEDFKQTFPRNSHKSTSFEDEIYQQNRETTRNTPVVSSTNVFSSTGSYSTTEENQPKTTFEYPSTTIRSTSEPTTEVELEREDSVEDFEDTDGSSELSADHLIAPGGVLPQEIPTKTHSLPAKIGKITKVYTPSPPPSGSNEISKLLSPFYPQQFSSEPPTNLDNEYQPNQIYPQTLNDNERISDTPYERNDMDW
jgi:hypothetical protein